MSVRLYYDDPYLLEFRATVVSVTKDPAGGNHGGCGGNAPCAVALDRTAFYPTSGGQPCDLGWIGGCEVSDVSQRDGEVVHILRSCEGIEPGRGVDCRVAPVRRRDHMQQHLGQHILSSAFEKTLDASTVGFHLGPESVTIDLDIPSLDESRANRAEDLANDIVMQDRPVNAVWLSRDEALRLPLRKAPDREDPLRIVVVEDFDYSPCGGTHPHRTGEVGVIKIVGWERAHAGVRVAFLCGSRALLDYRWKNATIAGIARRFSVAPREAGDVVAKQHDRAQSLAKRVDRLSAELLDYEAASLIAESAGGVAGSGAAGATGDTARSPAGSPVIVARSFAGRPLDEVKGLAARITSRGNTIALLSSSVDGALRVVFARSKDVRGDMNGLMESTMAAFGGRGGGTPMAAQGGLGPSGAGETDVRGSDAGREVISYALRCIRPHP